MQLPSSVPLPPSTPPTCSLPSGPSIHPSLPSTHPRSLPRSLYKCTGLTHEYGTEVHIDDIIALYKGETTALAQLQRGSKGSMQNMEMDYSGVHCALHWLTPMPPRQHGPGREPIPTRGGGAPFEGHARHVSVGAGRRAGTSIDVYVQEDISTRATLLRDKGNENALFMGVLTPWGRHHVPAGHPPPQSQVGKDPYVQW